MSSLSNRRHLLPVLVLPVAFLGACGDSAGDDAGNDAAGGSTPSVDGSGASGTGADSNAGGSVGRGSGGKGPPAGGAVGESGGMGGTETHAGGSAGVGAAPGGGAAATGGVSARECENTSPALSVELLDETRVAQLGVPFDTDREDQAGPLDWAAQYGKAPELIPFSSGAALDVLFQDQDSSEFAYVVHIDQASGSYEITHSYRVGSLGRIMGMTRDAAGNYYVATGVDEDARVDEIYPPNKVHRPDIVRIVKFDTSGCVLMESDVDMERGAADPEAEIIVNPMVAASSRLVWGNDRLLLVHGHNTEPDPELDGTRHQKAMSTHLSALDGSVTRTSTMWVSHSFDQRALYDGNGFVEFHLGDAYPRLLTLGRYSDAGGRGGYAAYSIKGDLGANNTYTRLGGIVQTNDPTYGYFALFATERSETAGADLVSGTRDVALVRVRSDFAESATDESVVEESGPTSSQTVTSAGAEVTNHVRWLTSLADPTHAERPRIAALPGNEFLVLYEQWSLDDDGRTDIHDGTFALRLDESGEVMAGPSELAGKHNISRGDDIVSLDGRAVYVTGGEGALHLNLVASDLSFARVSLP